MGASHRIQGADPKCDLPCMRAAPRWTEMPHLCLPPQEISLFSACLKFCLCCFSGWLESICQNNELLLVLGVLVLPAVPDLLFQDSLICSYVSLLVKPQGCSSPSLQNTCNALCELAFQTVPRTLCHWALKQKIAIKLADSPRSGSVCFLLL